MSKPGKPTSMIARNPLPSPDSTCPSDSENELSRELDEKRRSINEEISQFQVSKEKEFRDFEQALRLNKRQRQQKRHERHCDLASKSAVNEPKRTSPSSALDLLAGHGSSQKLSTSGSSSRLSRGTSTHTKESPMMSRKGPSPSKPTLSIDALNISGETFPQSSSNPSATPTLLARNNVLRSSQLSSPNESLSPSSTTEIPATQSGTAARPSRDANEAFVGILTPSYLPLLGPGMNSQNVHSSPLITPPVDVDDIDPIAQTVVLPNGILPLQSSSFPPHVTLLSPASTATKRAYTAPATTRMPSALRSASASNLAKKRKHVTFRLADSAIVDPSSSYEEGPSPIDDTERQSRSRSTTAVSHSSRKASSLRYSSVSPRNGLISDHTRSDEDDEAAGVKPGMSMDEVMQKLNSHFKFDDDEDIGWTDTKYHEDEDEDDEEYQRYSYNSSSNGDRDLEEEVADDDDHEDDQSEDEDENEAQAKDDRSEEDDNDSYFSPKFHEMSTVPTSQFSLTAKSKQHRDRSGSSPLTPIRDADWDVLSSSDKDRLLFSGGASDSDSDQRSSPHTSRHTHRQPHEKISLACPGSGFSGLKKTGSVNSLTSLTSFTKSGSNLTRSSKSNSPTQRSTQPSKNLPKFEDDLGPSVDGGSGIGFFELDEELAVPEAGKAVPFNNDADAGMDVDLDDSDDDIAISKPQRSPRTETIASGILGTGMASVPINIIRPSNSVSSSWVGTFGH